MQLDVFQYKDQLGNIRLSYADINGDGTLQPTTEILDERNYYPFGLEYKGAIASRSILKQ